MAKFNRKTRPASYGHKTRQKRPLKATRTDHYKPINSNKTWSDNINLKRSLMVKDNQLNCVILGVRFYFSYLKLNPCYRVVLRKAHVNVVVHFIRQLCSAVSKPLFLQTSSNPDLVPVVEYGPFSAVLEETRAPLWGHTKDQLL